MIQQESFPTCICPGCDQPMKVKKIEPIPNNFGLQKIIYRCEKCAVETERIQKEPDK